tara:strand:+ start:10972 stop:11673 length:702 start_codon:yes stop_codon:yes gene_type:complete
MDSETFNENNVKLEESNYLKNLNSNVKSSQVLLDSIIKLHTIMIDSDTNDGEDLYEDAFDELINEFKTKLKTIKNEFRDSIKKISNILIKYNRKNNVDILESIENKKQEFSNINELIDTKLKQVTAIGLKWTIDQSDSYQELKLAIKTNNEKLDGIFHLFTEKIKTIEEELDNALDYNDTLTLQLKRLNELVNGGKNVYLKEKEFNNFKLNLNNNLKSLKEEISISKIKLVKL